MKKIIFNSNFHLYEKDFSNFDMRFLKDKDNFSYMIISANHKSLGIIKDCSMSLVNIFGYEKKELIGKHINILIPEMFHQKHDFILRKTAENHKLNFSEISYKRKVYNPDFLEKNVYGLSRAKFLIPIRLFIYLINTEENELVYVVEVYRKIPLMNAIINNKLPCCVLTNENFVIQSFTPNCMQYLKLKDNHISNYDIISNIKEFHDDYVIDMNTTHLSKNCTIKESSTINHKKFKNNLNITSIKKSIKTDILNRYYYKKCRITWLINKRKKRQQSIRKRRSSSFNIAFKKNQINEIEIEIELDMEIKKILVENELVGYYFYFTPIKKEMKMENNKIKFIDYKEEGDNMHLQFGEINPNNLTEITENDKLNQTQIISDTQFFINEKLINQIRRKSCAEYNYEKDLIIGPDYICKSPSNFLFDINTLSYNYSTNRDNLKVMNDNLKREVITKIKINQFQYNSMKNRTKIFSLSQIKRHESTEIMEKSSSTGSYSNSKTSSYSSSNEYSEESGSSYVLSKKKAEPANNFKLGYIKKSTKNVMTEIRDSKASIKEKLNISTNDYLSIINKNDIIKEINTRMNNSMEFINSYYSVNLSSKNIHFLIFDFYKEIFVEQKDFQRLSTVELILRDLQKNNINDFADEEKYPMFLFENQNLMKRDEKEKIIEERKREEKKIRSKNEEKILERKIKYSINNEKDEIPIKRLKMCSILFLIILMILLVVSYIFFMSNYSKIKNLLILIKNIIKIKYCNRMSVFFVGESTLLNFNASKIIGGLFTNFPGKYENKKGYIDLMREKIKETFIESEQCLEEILSTRVSFSKNTTKFLEKHVLDTNYILSVGMESIFSDIFTTLLQYNGAFYNLAFSPLDLEQNHTDILNFLHNSFNDYVRGINILISTYINEMDELAKSIYLYWILALAIYLLIYVASYIIIIQYYIMGNNKRTSYLEVFYELNENVLKILISNCENLFKKLKMSELKEEEDEVIDENIDKRVYYLFKEKQNRRNSLFAIRKSEPIVNHSKMQKRLPRHTKNFMFFFGLCLLISFLFFIFNAFYSINIAEDAKYISKYLDKSQHFQTVMIDLFVAYRQYIFDDSIIIYNMMPFDYLSTTLIKSYETVKEDTYFIKNFNKKYLSSAEVNEHLTQNFCNYNYTDRYTTYEQCSTELSFLLNYDFTIIASNFMETLRKSIYVVKYLLSTGKIVCGLNDYDQDKWLQNETTPRVGGNNPGNYIFRLDLYNDDTVHGYLDLIFVNILLPYIDINRKYIIPYLSIEGKTYYLKLTTTFYVLFVVGVFLIYLLLKVKFLNKNIYKTKNLLRLIPLNILLSLPNIKTLLDLN